jgi:hypothetical protein
MEFMPRSRHLQRRWSSSLDLGPKIIQRAGLQKMCRCLGWLYVGGGSTRALCATALQHLDARAATSGLAAELLISWLDAVILVLDGGGL